MIWVRVYLNLLQQIRVLSDLFQVQTQLVLGLCPLWDTSLFMFSCERLNFLIDACVFVRDCVGRGWRKNERTWTKTTTYWERQNEGCRQGWCKENREWSFNQSSYGAVSSYFQVLIIRGKIIVHNLIVWNSIFFFFLRIAFKILNLFWNVIITGSSIMLFSV